MNEEDPFGVRAVAVSGVVSSALIAALVQKLAEKGLLSPTDVNGIYDDALHSLERRRADADPEDAEMYRKACAIIDDALRDTPLPDSQS